MTLSSRIARSKKSRRVSWDDLADECDIASRQALQQKVSKRSLEKDLQMLRRLAKALGVNPAWLAFGIGRKGQ